MLINTKDINMDTHKEFILASSSISRFKILTNCGFVFRQVNPSCNEEEIKKKLKKINKPVNIAKRLSFEKAKSLSLKRKYFNKHVIGCDTLIYLENEIFDKAKNLREARLKLKKLSGKTHNIVSGLTICHKVRPFQIDEYLRKTGKQILHSVGCYQLESLGPQIIEDIKGDYFNVLGLPLFKLLKYTQDIQ